MLLIFGQLRKKADNEMICNQEVEMMPREQLIQLQTERLQREIKWAYEKSPFYNKMMREYGLKPADIQSVEDLHKLPFTTREDLEKNTPFDFLTGPLSSMLRVRQSGGGRPIIRICTNGDVARGVEMTVRALAAGGVNMTSVVELGAYYLGTSLCDIQYAAEVIGATVMPPDSAASEERIKLIDILGANVLASDANGLLKFLITAQAMGYDMTKSTISTLFCINTKLDRKMNYHLKSRYQADIFNIYAPLESGMTAMFYECEKHESMHLQEDYYYAEIINMQTGEIVTDGSMGELVITSLVAEAMPCLRYRTGQIASLDRHTECKCGRTFARVIVP